MIRMLEQGKMRGMVKILIDFPFSRSLPTRLSNLYIISIKKKRINILEIISRFFESIDQYNNSIIIFRSRK